jgi:hypothetical protein
MTHLAALVSRSHLRDLRAWIALENQQQKMSGEHLRSLFADGQPAAEKAPG